MQSANDGLVMCEVCCEKEGTIQVIDTTHKIYGPFFVCQGCYDSRPKGVLVQSTLYNQISSCINYLSQDIGDFSSKRWLIPAIVSHISSTILPYESRGEISEGVMRWFREHGSKEEADGQ